MKSKVLHLHCNPGCHHLTFTAIFKNYHCASDDIDEWYISFFGNLFYEGQSTWWTRLKYRLELIWAIIRGKEYRLFDMVVSDKNMKEFVRKYQSHK